MNGLLTILGVLFIEHMAITLPILLMILIAVELERIRRQVRMVTWLLAGAKVKPGPDDQRP
jgi:hypothetical protein